MTPPFGIQHPCRSLCGNFTTIRARGSRTMHRADCHCEAYRIRAMQRRCRLSLMASQVCMSWSLDRRDCPGESDAGAGHRKYSRAGGQQSSREWPTGRWTGQAVSRSVAAPWPAAFDSRHTEAETATWDASTRQHSSLVVVLAGWSHELRYAAMTRHADEQRRVLGTRLTRRSGRTA